MQQPKILVAIRKRPLSKKEVGKGESDIVSVKNSDTVIVSEYKQKVDLTKFLEETIFNFDFAFDEQTQNEEIYDQAVRPLVDSAFQGARVTCFAYGQTGSGKTHTMNGNMAQGVRGLYTLGANDIFDYLSDPQFRHLKAKLSFYQIYCGKLFDLLNKRQELKLREDNKNNINIIGLEEATISTSEEFIDLLAHGSQQRVTSQNSANADSSRSHAILQISLKDGKKLHGKISFIDLAGNERGADHMDMDKQTRIDGAEINKSLLSLKECIRALDQGKGHTPFRGSKLTMVLKDSFVGFCRTVMIGNVSPSSASSENTLNTLRYADRVKQLRKPTEGGGSKEEQKAKEMMLPRQNKNAIRIMINNDDDAEDIARKRDEAQKEYGIAEEPPKRPQKEEPPVLRKNSIGGNKAMPLGKDNKSNSLAKNYQANNLGNRPVTSNNIVNPPPSLQQKQPVVNLNNRNEQSGMTRYNSSAGGVLNKKEEPMEIQMPSSTPYYVPSGSKNVASRAVIGQQRGNFQPQPSLSNYSSVSSQSQNISQNYSQISLSSNQMSQQSKGNYPQQQQDYYQPNPNRMANSSNYPNMNNSANMQPGFNYNYQQQQGYGGNFQNYQPNNPNFQQNYQQQQAMNFNGYPQQNNFMPVRGQSLPVQPLQMPEKWEDLVSFVGNAETGINEQVLAEMNHRLFKEEGELMNHHSQTLRREVDTIKSEMGLLNDMEADRSKISSRGYVRFMQESIEQKISSLEMLRERLINFTYKLDETEELEGGTSRPHGIDDEQLLDDIN